MKKKRIAVILAAALLFAASPAALADGPSAARLDIMTQAVYDEFGTFSEGLVWALKDGQFSYLDENGRTVISPAALRAACADEAICDVRSFYNGLAVIYGEKRVYYIDKQGRQVFSADWGFSFSGGLALGFVNGDLVLFDTSGKAQAVSFPAEAKSAEYWDCGILFSEGLLPFWITAGGAEHNGYVDADFNVAIPLRFEDARPFNGGLAPVKLNGKWGFINRDGHMVIQPQYDDFIASDADYRHQVFRDGLAAVKKGGKWGYIDQAGGVAIPFIFDQAGQFSEGYAIAGSGGQYGYIDTGGQFALSAAYDDANGFHGGTALVGVGGEYRLIGPDGKPRTPHSWRFDGTLTALGAQQTALYSLGGKWGLLKINGGSLDSADGWAVAHIEEAIAKGFVPSGIQGSYAQPVTRAEFVYLAMNWLRVRTKMTDAELVAQYAVAPERTFVDVDNDPVILAAGKLDITSGTNAALRQFGPDAVFTREQAAMMLVKVHTILNQTGGGYNTAEPPDFGWADIMDAAPYMRDAINFVGFYSVMSGDGMNFNPNETFSRQHSVTVFNNIDRTMR